MNERICKAALALLACAASCAGPREPASTAHYDLLLRGGTVYDGLGGPGMAADVAVRGDRIVGIGSFAGAEAALVLDVSGLAVAPGFVDIHTHSDASIFRHPGAQSRVRQGVTTEITGNCGSSAAPRPRSGRSSEEDPEEAASARRWTDVRSYADAWRLARPALNHAMLVGHGTLRSAVIGDEDRKATEAELSAMEAMLDEAMRQGAIGMSTGLEYVPGIYSEPAEIERLARVVARHGGLYSSHMRSEEEALPVGRRSGVRVQISHLKSCGRANWPLLEEAIARIERARSDGVDVMADAYPYTAYSTTLTILLEPWSREGGADAILARLRTPDLRAKMLAELDPHVAGDPGGYELIVIAGVNAKEHENCVGRSLQEIGAAWGCAPAEACLALLEASGADVSFLGHGIQQEGVARVLAHPLVMVGSDGSSRAPVPRAVDRPHPRSYGAFPRALGRYGREQGLFDLPTAVRKMTSMPAERAGLSDRGRIAAGAFADLVVFDPDRVLDEATYQDPQRYPTGIRHVFVNGEAALLDGEETGRRSGRWLGQEAR
jgi:N-acyl-D-amino-acid deacylase